MTSSIQLQSPLLMSYTFDSCNTDHINTLFEGLLELQTLEIHQTGSLNKHCFIIFNLYLKPALQITVHVLTDIPKACSVASHMD